MRLTGIKVMIKPSGRRYVYRLVNGKLHRLPDLPENHPEFIAAWQRAGEAPSTRKRKVGAGTVEALASAYMISDQWRALARNTQMMRARIIRKIVDARGIAPVSGLRPQHIEADLKGMSPIAANDRRKVWLALCKFAIADDGFTLAENPAAGVTRRPVKSVGHQPWAPEHFTLFRARWPVGTPQRLAFELFLWTGARCSDARLLGRQMIDAKGWLVFQQQKTRVPVSIPLTAALPDWCSDLAGEQVQLLACIDKHSGLTFNLTEFGAPRSEKGISQWFGKAAREAKIPMGYAAHGLRKNCGMRLAEMGATTHQIMAWLGHLSLSESELYTRAANRRRVLEGTERNAKTVYPEPKVSDSGENQ